MRNKIPYSIKVANVNHSLISVFTIIFTISSLLAVGQTNSTTYFSTYRACIVILELIGLSIIINDFASIIKTKLNTIVFTWFLWVIIGCLIITPLNFIENIREIIFWPIIFLTYFSLAKTNVHLIEKSVKLYSIIFISATPIFIYLSNTKTIALDKENILASINQIYYILLLLPWILLIKKDLFRHLLFFSILLLCLLSAKRTAIIIIGISLITYILTNYKMVEHKLRYGIIMISIITISISIFMQYKNSSTDFLINRFENIDEDRGSGREEIYIRVINMITNSTPENIIVGNGHNSVRVNSKSLSAHNDFLEVTYDYGIVGLGLYIILHILLIKRIIFFKKIDKYYNSYLTSYLIFFIMSIFSHLILYPTYFVYLTAYWGSMEALKYQYHANKLQ